MTSAWLAEFSTKMISSASTRNDALLIHKKDAYEKNDKDSMVSLVQVGDMRAAWKKMKAGGITSDIGLRYAYISGVKAGAVVPCCCCLNTICCLE